MDRFNFQNMILAYNAVHDAVLCESMDELGFFEDSSSEYDDTDSLDFIISYLVNEGYADSLESAEIILEYMSDDWIESVLNEARGTVMSVTSPEGVERRLNIVPTRPSRRLEGEERLTASRRMRQQAVDRSFADPKKVIKFRRRYGLSRY